MKIGINKQYIIFGIIYTLITIYLLSIANKYQSGTIVIMIALVLFWIVAGIILGILLFFDKQRQFKRLIDYVILSFCTPIPTFIFLFIMLIPSYNKEIKSDINGKTEYYNLGIEKRKMITLKYSIFGGIKEVQKFKLDSNINWIKDGNWLYYDKKENITKEVCYRNDSLIKTIYW